MKVTNDKNNIILEDVKDFLLSQTLECGQCFHFIKTGEEEYFISAMNKKLHIAQQGNNLIFYDTTEGDYFNIWEKYFDLDRDYGEIKNALLRKDELLKPAIDAMWGVRILNQDFFETLISFIISQNQQIPRIKNIIRELSLRCGRNLGDDMYSFPCAKEILMAGEETVRECKAGFRAPYIIDACKKVSQGVINENKLLEMSYEDCMETLKTIKGVGDKVANCVSLFSLNKRNAFPVDVWIKRIMEELYMKKPVPVQEIQSFAAEQFGEYGGYAQQYLFYYGKINKIGKK